MMHLVFQFLLGTTVVPRQMEDIGYAKFWGVNKVSMAHVKTVNLVNYV